MKIAKIAPSASIVYHFWYLSSFSKSYFSSSEMDVEVLTWLTASIMNWKWVWKSQMGESFVRGEPREVKKLIRVRNKYRKQILVKFDMNVTFDMNECRWNIELKVDETARGCFWGVSVVVFCYCFFFSQHCEINARATNKSGEKLTVAGFWGGFWFGSQQEVIEAIPSMTTKACSWFIKCQHHHSNEMKFGLKVV